MITPSGHLQIACKCSDEGSGKEVVKHRNKGRVSFSFCKHVKSAGNAKAAGRMGESYSSDWDLNPFGF